MEIPAESFPVEGNIVKLTHHDDACKVVLHSDCQFKIGYMYHTLLAGQTVVFPMRSILHSDVWIISGEYEIHGTPFHGIDCSGETICMYDVFTTEGLKRMTIRNGLVDLLYEEDAYHITTLFLKRSQNKLKNMMGGAHWW